jgi:hypothetical protein
MDDQAIRIIAEALGHESLESTKIYTQVSFAHPPHRRVICPPGGLNTRCEKTREINRLAKGETSRANRPDEIRRVE